MSHAIGQICFIDDDWTLPGKGLGISRGNFPKWSLLVREWNRSGEFIKLVILVWYVFVPFSSVKSPSAEATNQVTLLHKPCNNNAVLNGKWPRVLTMVKESRVFPHRCGMLVLGGFGGSCLYGSSSRVRIPINIREVEVSNKYWVFWMVWFDYFWKVIKKILIWGPIEGYQIEFYFGVNLDDKCDRFTRALFTWKYTNFATVFDGNKNTTTSGVSIIPPDGVVLLPLTSSSLARTRT